MTNTIDSFFKFFTKSESGNGCWEWEGGLNQGNYGIFCAVKTRFGAHRFSYELHKGPIPKGMMVCHTCDNPPCVNPDHLFLGTAKDNCHDMIRKNRRRSIVLTKKDRSLIRTSLKKRTSNRGGLIKWFAAKYSVLPATIQRVVRKKN